MSLTLKQRLDRLEVRVEELKYWREREIAPIERWTFEGEPIRLGDPWPRRDGVVRLGAEATVPEHWPLDETRLKLDVGGESLLSLRCDDGEPVRFGLDPYHREFPIGGRTVRIEA